MDRSEQIVMFKRNKLVNAFYLVSGVAIAVLITIFGMQSRHTSSQAALISSPNSKKLTPPSEQTVELPNQKLNRAIGISIARSGSLSKSLKFSSTVESRNPGTATVTSLVHGVVTKVLVDVGDVVKPGQIVAYINCPEISDAQSAYVERSAHEIEAKANISLVKTRLALAQRESARLEELLAEGISAKKDLEAAQSKNAGTEAELQTSVALLAASEIQLTAAASRLRSLGIEPTRMRIDKLSTELPLRSPINGLVSQKTAQVGQQVGPLSGASNPSLFTIVDLSKVWVMLEVPQSEISRIRNGAKVTFTSEVAPGKKFNGRVTKLGQNFDSMSRTASVRTEIENKESILKPGMMVLANVDIPGSNSNVIIPSTAVQKHSNQNVVFKKIASSRFKAVIVSIANDDGFSSEVVSGICPGDMIVTKGAFLLKSELMKGSIGGEE